MLFIVIFALIIVICILSIHYCQHFELKYKACNSTTRNFRSHSASIMELQFNMLQATRCHYRCCLSFSPVDDENFDFFPVSFLLYLIFMTLLFILILIIEIQHLIQDPDSHVLFYHSHSFNTLRSLNTATIMDHILVYSTLILFIWVSLFAFYRYYTTHILMQTMNGASNTPLFKRFSVYAVLFCIMFLLQIHIHYYLWSLVVLFWCSFNWFCNWKFSKILIEKIEALIYLDDGYSHTAADQEMLNGVIFTKNTSLICCAIQTINLCVFVITYNVNTLYYLSLLWSVSAFILGVNFIRNRKFIERKLFHCKQCCKCIKFQNVETLPTPSKIPSSEQKTPIKLHIHPEQLKVPPLKTIQTSKSHEEYVSMDIKTDDDEDIQTNIQSKTPPLGAISYAKSSDHTHKMRSKPPLLRAITDPLKIKSYNKINHEPIHTQLMAIDSGEEISKLDLQTQCPTYKPPKSNKPRVTLTVNTETTDDVMASLTSTPSFTTPMSEVSSSRRQKALELLGITHTPKTAPHSTPISSNIITFNGLAKPTRNKKQTSDTISTTLSPQSVTFNPGLKKQVTTSKSTYVTMESDEESTPSPGATAVDDAVTTTTAIVITTTEMIKEHMDHSHFEESLTVPRPQMSFTRSNSMEEKHEMDINEVKQEGIHELDVAKQRASIELSHHEAFLSMDMLAKYGFCDKTSINSAKQMREYQRSLEIIPPLPTMPSLDESQ